MRYAITCLSAFFILFLGGCSSDDINYEKTALIGESNVIKIEAVENHQVIINGDEPIPLSKLESRLNELPKTEDTIVSIIFSEDLLVGDLTEIQRALQDAEMLRINYATKNINKKKGRSRNIGTSLKLFQI